MNNYPKKLTQLEAEMIEESLIRDMGFFYNIDNDYDVSVIKHGNKLTLKISDVYGNVFTFKRELRES